MSISGKTRLIVGPPGTGKTTELLRRVDELLARGVIPENIAFIAFTRKAANEARHRAMEKFQFTADQLPWFRTLHSLAFYRLGIQRTQVLGVKDYLAICAPLGLHLTFRNVNEDGTLSGHSKGDRLLFTEQMARARMMPLKEYWELYPDEDLYWWELERLAKTVEQYKKSQGKLDFIDMIERFCADADVPEFHTLVVDEAQDLSTVQWKMVTRLVCKAQEVHIAGDDDQAIFRWAGADVQGFQEYPRNDMLVLPQSYRVPRKVQEVADEVISRVATRIPKAWAPRDVDGDVQHVRMLDDIDMSRGTWLLLARNKFLLQEYNDFCIRAGWVFESSLGSPVKPSTIEAIRLWENLRKGNTISVASAMKVYEFMSVKVGVAYGSKTRLERMPEDQQVNLQDLRTSFGLLTDSIWHEAFDKIPAEERQYFIAALKNGEKLLKEPRIKISTIHGVKGGEADSVVVMCDMAQRTFREYQQSPDDEHRVWYVAVTRARERLFIVEPRTKMCYVV